MLVLVLILVLVLVLDLVLVLVLVLVLALVLVLVSCHVTVGMCRRLTEGQVLVVVVEELCRQGSNSFSVSVSSSVSVKGSKGKEV